MSCVSTFSSADEKFAYLASNTAALLVGFATLKKDSGKLGISFYNGGSCGIPAKLVSETVPGWFSYAYLCFSCLPFLVHLEHRGGLLLDDEKPVLAEGDHFKVVFGKTGDG